MTAENPVSKEIPNLPSFIESLKKLSDIKEPIPLDPTKIDVEDLKQTLYLSNIDLEELKKSEEFILSISKSKFKNMDSGRGPAMVQVFKTRENLQSFFDWTVSESENQNKLNHGDDESRARGLRQFGADIIALAVDVITPEEFCRKTNWRVGKKYSELSKKFNLPTDEEGKKKLKETVSIPKGSAIKAYEFILSLNK